MNDIAAIAVLAKQKSFLRTKDIMAQLNISRAHALLVMKEIGLTLDFTYIPGSGELMTPSVIKYDPNKREELLKKCIAVFGEMKTDTISMLEVMSNCKLNFQSAVELSREIVSKFPSHFKLDEPLSENNLKESEVFLIYVPTT